METRRVFNQRKWTKSLIVYCFKLRWIHFGKNDRTLLQRLPTYPCLKGNQISVVQETLISETIRNGGQKIASYCLSSSTAYSYKEKKLENYVSLHYKCYKIPNWCIFLGSCLDLSLALCIIFEIDLHVVLAAGGLFLSACLTWVGCWNSKLKITKWRTHEEYVSFRKEENKWESWTRKYNPRMNRLSEACCLRGSK